jgi:hypothetical protein
MRIPLLLVLLLSAAPLHAKEPPREVILSEDGGAQVLSGTAAGGSRSSFTLKSVGDRIVTFKLEGDNNNCSAELQTSAQRGFMSDFGRFPTTRSEPAKNNETFVLSVFQTRGAWMNKTPCDFSLSVQ